MFEVFVDFEEHFLFFDVLFLDFLPVSLELFVLLVIHESDKVIQNLFCFLDFYHQLTDLVVLGFDYLEKFAHVFVQTLNFCVFLFLGVFKKILPPCLLPRFKQLALDDSLQDLAQVVHFLT